MGRRLFAYLFCLFSIGLCTFGTGDKELIRLNGVVQTRHIAESPWSSVFASKFVEDTDWIQTHENSLARLDFHHGKQTAKLSERTLVQVESVTPEKITLHQFMGEIEVVVHHFFDKPVPVEVITPSAVMAVKGSEAICRVAPDGTTTVASIQGHIEVTAAGKTIKLTPGQSVFVNPGSIPKLQTGPAKHVESQKNLHYHAAKSSPEKSDSATKTQQAPATVMPLDQSSSNSTPSKSDRSAQSRHGSSNILLSKQFASKSGSPMAKGPSFGAPSVEGEIAEALLHPHYLSLDPNEIHSGNAPSASESVHRAIPSNSKGNAAEVYWGSKPMDPLTQIAAFNAGISKPNEGGTSWKIPAHIALPGEAKPGLPPAPGLPHPVALSGSAAITASNVSTTPQIQPVQAPPPVIIIQPSTTGNPNTWTTGTH